MSHIRFALIRVCTKQIQGGPLCDVGKFSEERYIWYTLQLIKLVKSVTSLVFKKGSAIVVSLYESAN